MSTAIADDLDLDLGELLAPDGDDWKDRGLCAQTDPEAFFPEKGGSTTEAKRICRECEVRPQCLEYALNRDERFGIWGGLSERERRTLTRARRRRPAREPDDGTRETWTSAYAAGQAGLATPHDPVSRLRRLGFTPLRGSGALRWDADTIRGAPRCPVCELAYRPTTGRVGCSDTCASLHAERGTDTRPDGELWPTGRAARELGLTCGQRMMVTLLRQLGLTPVRRQASSSRGYLWDPAEVLRAAA